MIKRIIKQIETPTELISQIITELGGGGGGTSQQYIDGEVEYHQYLPTGIGNPATNVAFLVKKGQGIWLVNRKPAGIWVRETDNGNLNDWIYAGSFPDVYNDANFRIYDNDDSSKNLAFNLDNLNSNTTVTLTIPPSGGTVITSNDTGAFYPSNNPSGFITSQNVVYATGDQTISGLKDFVSRPTVNTVPVLLSGEVNTVISGVFFTAEVNIKNDNGSTIYKGQPVYISSAAGANILVKLASNTGEATSSKTFGLVNQSSLAQNAQGTVVTEGLIQNVNTSAAGNEGDPIWLGTTGDLIYGLVNKPKAPNHLVYLGVVTRKHATQGEIFVHIQNGFEVRELHDARIINEQDKDVLIYNSGSGLWLNRQITTGDVSGISNYVTVSNLGTTIQKFVTPLSTGIESYTGTFNTAFSSVPAIVANIKTTGATAYATNLTQITATGFAVDFSDIILESGVILNIIAYDGQFN